MNHQEYNGWYNYETWVVNLWMDNEEASYRFWRDETASLLKRSKPAQHFTSEEQAMLTLCEMLKSEHEAALPELQGFASDLLGAAMSEVNWREIAEHLIADAKEQA